MTNDKIDAAIREVTAIVPDSRDRAIYLAGYEAGVEAREKRVAELEAALADERERRKAAVMALVELIAVADENDALMMERLYGKPHGVEHKARTLDHMQRKSEAWRNARVYLTRYKD